MTEYTVNLDAFLKNRETHSIVKSLMYKIKAQGYVPVAEYIQGLSDEDLEWLVDLVGEGNESENYQKFFIDLSIGLLLAEGSDINTSTINVSTGLAPMYILMESLARKGLCAPVYEAWGMDVHRDTILANPVV